MEKRLGVPGLKTPPAEPGTSTPQTKQVQPVAPATTTLAGISLPIPPPGGALDHLVIPAIGLSRYVVQGVDESDLQMGPGHYPGTPLPGQRQLGNVGIAGHRTTFGAPFFRLNEVAHGDLILLTDTSGTTWVYRVVRQWVVDPSDTAVLDQTHTAMLTLTTCNPRFEATSRLVVRAALLRRVPPGPKAAPAPANETSDRTRATVAGNDPSRANHPTLSAGQAPSGQALSGQALCNGRPRPPTSKAAVLAAVGGHGWRPLVSPCWPY